MELEETVLHVRADGTGDAPDLVTALERSTEGARIVLDAGTHRFDACVEISWPVRVEGAGRELTFVEGNVPEDWWVVIEEGALGLADLTLRRVAVPQEIVCADVIGCRGGFVAIERATIEGAVEIDDAGGVGVRVEGGDVSLLDAIVRDCQFAAVAVQQRGRAEVRGGELAESGLGLVIDAGCVGTISGVRFRAIAQHAIVVLGEAEIDACTYEGIGGEEVLQIDPP